MKLISARFDSRLVVSKASSCASKGSRRLFIARHAITRRLARVERAGDIRLHLWRIDLPKLLQLGNRVVIAPVNAQVNHRPGTVTHHADPRRVYRSAFTPLRQSRAQGGNQATAQ